MPSAPNAPCRLRRLDLLYVLLVGHSLTAIVSTACCAATLDFDRTIRPILAEHCFACHGPDEQRREGNLRLDTLQGQQIPGDSGNPAVVAGHPEASELIRRITGKDLSSRMPPEETQDELNSQEIALLRQWIDEGAVWQQHWAYEAPARPALPSVRNSAWPRNEVDYFVLHRLESESLIPEREAHAVTLVRRLYFDLTGLPPTPDDVSVYLDDVRHDAYERLVDRLLDSPRFGEHMARYWLDAARYGDTHGLHLDNYREMWPYRDWVIRAFNANMPFNRFTVAQLAGDLLPSPSRDDLIATGFNRCHVTTNEGGSISAEVEVRNVVDRVTTLGTVFMGMTLECTRCHDHKYDPLTMNDFYSLYAFFNGLDGEPMDGNRKDHPPVIAVPTAAQQAQLRELDAQIADLERWIYGAEPRLDAMQSQWEAAVAPGDSPNPSTGSLELSSWHTVGPFSEVERYLYSRKHGPEGKAVDLSESFRAADGSALRWQARPEWADGQTHADLPGESAANFLVRTLHCAERRTVKASFGSNDAIKVFLNGKQIHSKENARIESRDELALELQAGNNELLVKLMNATGTPAFIFQCDDVSQAIPSSVQGALAKSPDDRNEYERQRVRFYFRFHVVSDAELASAIAELRQRRGEHANVERHIVTTLIWREKSTPVPAFKLLRGEYDQPGEERHCQTPACLPPLAASFPVNRLGLAQWLVSGQHPLTARVTVNRLWQQLFGIGLVKTSEDFGTRGERPSHPELLDWLAVQFVADGWDVKQVLKRIVTSATYRQSSHAAPEKRERDPNNRLLSRGPRFRLDAEQLRDQALASSGLLTGEIGGPSVKPPQPDGLWYAVGFSGSNTVRFRADQGHDKVHRRTLYTFIKRTAPPPQLSTFDVPSREACTVRRERTNTPMQALLLFNDPQYLDAARALAELTLRQPLANDAERAIWIFRRATSRRPTDEELAELLTGFEQDLATYQDNLTAAEQLTAVGAVPPDGSLPPAPLAAWTLTASLLFNLDEVITRN